MSCSAASAAEIPAQPRSRLMLVSMSHERTQSNAHAHVSTQRQLNWYAYGVDFDPRRGSRITLETKKGRFMQSARSFEWWQSIYTNELYKIY